MKNKEQQKQIKKVIQGLLISLPELRDNDERLVSNVLYKHLKDNGTDAETITGMELLKLYSEGKLPTIDYITRVRRKLQEDIAELRGASYKERQEKAKVVKEKIKKGKIEETL
jgi:hypothetical protein